MSWLNVIQVIHSKLENRTSSTVIQFSVHCTKFQCGKTDNMQRLSHKIGAQKDLWASLLDLFIVKNQDDSPDGHDLMNP